MGGTFGMVLIPLLSSDCPRGEIGLIVFADSKPQKLSTLVQIFPNFAGSCISDERFSALVTRHALNAN